MKSALTLWANLEAARDNAFFGSLEFCKGISFLLWITRQSKESRDVKGTTCMKWVEVEDEQ